MNPALPKIACIIYKHASGFYSSNQSLQKCFLKPSVGQLSGVVKTFVTFLLAQITETHLRAAPDSQFRCNIRNCTTCPYIEHGNQSTFNFNPPVKPQY